MSHNGPGLYNKGGMAMKRIPKIWYVILVLALGSFLVTVFGRFSGPDVFLFLPLLFDLVFLVPIALWLQHKESHRSK